MTHYGTNSTVVQVAHDELTMYPQNTGTKVWSLVLCQTHRTDTSHTDTFSYKL